MTTDALVLVVDDDASVRRGLTRALRAAGYTVESFDDARDLLARLASVAAPSCDVSDVRMPGMDGLALAREIKASRSRRPSARGASRCRSCSSPGSWTSLPPSGR